MANPPGKPGSRSADARQPPAWHARLTRIAFWLLVAIVVTRATMQENLREPFEPPAGDAAPNVADVVTPRSPGPATSLALDLFCCVPVFLILSRRIFDPSYIIRFNWSHALIAAIAIWSAVTVARAGDKFAAMVGSANFIAALIVIWSLVQLVRSWERLRLAAAVTFGLLLIYVVAGLEYRLADLPVLRKNWEENKQQILQQQGLQPGSFAAEQFEKKVIGGDVGRFANSPNTYAAALVLMGLVAAGVAIQRFANRDRIGWLAPLAIALPPYAYILISTRSRAGIGLGILGLVFLAAIALLRKRLPGMSRWLYWAGAAVFLVAALAVVGHGLRYNSLGDKSLTFRWYYWTGAARIIAQHPVAGVGWGNFGEYYLAARGPGAVEEVKDPHNFIVRAFVETGAVGGILMIAWMLRLWWELTRPIVPHAPAEPASARAAHPVRGRRTIVYLSLISAATMLLGAVASTDWDQPSDWIVLQSLRYAIGALLLLAGIVAVAGRSLLDEQLDDRPCPWVLYAMLAALGVFLMHNLLDLAMSETAALFLFALVLGAALGAAPAATFSAPAPWHAGKGAA